MNHRCRGLQRILIQSLVTHEVPRRSLESAQIARLLAPLPDAKRPSRVRVCQRSAIWCPTPKLISRLKHVAASKSLVELTRDGARVQGQPAGKEEDSETSDEIGPLPVPKPSQVVSGRRRHRLRLLVNHFMCRDGRSKESVLERRDVRTLAARRNHPTALGTFLKFGKERALHLVEDVEVEGSLVAYSNDCSVQGVQHHMVHSFLWS